jgi:hypothetical protein
MIDISGNFLSSRLPITGLVAYSIHSGDRVLEAQCFSKSLYPSSAEHLLNSLVLSGQSLLPPGEVAAQYCWVFECLRVYVAARADGVCLALLVENNPGVKMAKIQETLQAFVEMVAEEVT